MKRSGRLALWLILLPFCAVVAAIAAFFLAVNHTQIELEKYRATLAARGEKLAIQDLVPASSLEADNGAPALIAIARRLAAASAAHETSMITPGQFEKSPGLAEVLHRRKSAIKQERDVPWDSVEAALEPLSPGLAQLRQATQAQILDLQPNYLMGFATSLDFLPPLIKSVQLLAAESVLDLRAGKPAPAVENVEATLRISEMLSHQHLLISQLVALSALSIGQITTWEILQSDSVTPPQLAALQAAWERLRPAAAFADTLRMERATALPNFDEDWSRATPGYFTGSPPSSSLPGTPAEWKAAFDFTLWKAAYRYSDERHFLENYQAILDASQSLSLHDDWRPVFGAIAKVESTFASAGLSRLFSQMVMPAIQSSARRFPIGAAIQRLAIAAIALKRYQLDHQGELPAQLAGLVPGYLREVPIDPMDGQPLRYRPSGHTFLLYSVGADATDNGGNAAKPPGAPRSRMIGDRTDIVWPQPVK